MKKGRFAVLVVLALMSSLAAHAYAPGDVSEVSGYEQAMNDVGKTTDGIMVEDARAPSQAWGDNMPFSGTETAAHQLRKPAAENSTPASLQMAALTIVCLLAAVAVVGRPPGWRPSTR